MYVYYDKFGKKEGGKVIIKNTLLFTNEKGTSDILFYKTNRIFYETKCLNILENVFNKLKNGKLFFSNCTNLKTVNANLSSLINGQLMFSDCTGLTSFNGDMSDLIDGYDMFYGCISLGTFSGDLSSLSNGGGMFWKCESLESFNSNLSSLNSGTYMFSNCRLNLASVANIAETIKVQPETGHQFGLTYKSKINDNPNGNTTGNSNWTSARTAAINVIKNKKWEVNTSLN